MKLSIVIPCYNELETIEGVLQRVTTVPLPSLWEREVIVVDDGSTDGTRAVLERISTVSSTSPVRVHMRQENGGKGAAVKDGLRLATGDYVIIQDADMEYDPSDYSALLQPVIKNGERVVFGSRSLGQNIVPYSRIYFYGGLLVTKIYNVLFLNRQSDIASCYKLFHRDFVLALLASPYDDFVFDAVDLTLALTKGRTVPEVPISYHARSKQGGKKLNWEHGIEIVLALFVARLGIPVSWRREVSSVAKFVATGGSTAVVHLSTLYLLTEYVGLWYITSSIIAFLCAFALSFTLHKFWTFQNKGRSHMRGQMAAHFSVASFNLVLNTTIMYALVEFFGVWYMLAQVLASALIAIETFLVLRYIYRKRG